MNAKNILDNLRAQGATITLDGERLLFTAPAGATPQQKAAMLAELRGVKQEAISFLRGGDKGPIESELSEGYEVAKGVKLYPPSMSQEHLDWRERIERYGRNV
jgi:hypothetical protein